MAMDNAWLPGYSLSVNNQRVNSCGCFASYLQAQLKPHHHILTNQLQANLHPSRRILTMDNTADRQWYGFEDSMHQFQPSFAKQQHHHQPYRISTPLESKPVYMPLAQYPDHLGGTLPDLSIANDPNMPSALHFSSRTQARYNPFRPAGSTFETAAMTLQPAPKVETSPTLAKPGVLTSDVPAWLYEPTTYNEILQAPIEYGGSPSVADSPDSLPETPGSPGYSSFTGCEDHKDSFFNTDSLFPIWPRNSFATSHVSASPPLPPASHGMPLVVPSYQQQQSFVSPDHLQLQVVPTATTAPSTQDDEVSHNLSSFGSTSPASSAGSPPSLTGDDEATSRQERDALLLELRSAGLSYKDIKAEGGFREAESTLRGRIRMLTKEKSMRVRKPKWERGDIELLRRTVKHFERADLRPGSNRGRGADRKLPWKKISEKMVKDASSYPFAPATCAKKWMEISRGI